MRFLLFLPGILLLVLSVILTAKSRSDNPKPTQEKDDPPDVFVGYIITHDHKQE